MVSEATQIVYERFASTLLRHVVPICHRDKKGHLQGFGTGFIVSKGAKNFVVTAAHVLDALEDEELCFPCANLKMRNVCGPGLTSKCPPGKTRDSDRVDIGVVLLEGDGQPPYPEVGKCALPFEWLTPNAQPRQNKQYFLTGFPAKKTRTHFANKEVESYVYSSLFGSVEAIRYKKLHLTPEANLCFEFLKRDHYTLDEKRINPPGMRGVSGSPIWLFYDRAGANDPTKVPLVGVFIEHRHRQSVLVGSDISPAIDMIEKLDKQFVDKTV